MRMFLTRSLLCMIVAIAPLSAAIVVVPSQPAQAQEETKRRTVIDFLFGPRRLIRRKTSRQPAYEQPRRAQPQQRSVRRSTSGGTAAPAVEAVEKLDNARKILVVGDFMAKGLYDGLKVAFAQSPGVRVLEETSGSSGLVRDDYFDWPENLPGFLDEHQPTIVIVMIGSNDRQELRLPEGRLAVRSESWVNEYSKRIGEISQIIRDRNLPLIWVGSPSYKSSSMSADMAAINDMTRTVVAETGGEFVDIWEGFVNENGQFVFTGSDIKGQQVRLRTSDGIRMTRAGRRKLAFYTEKPLRKLLGSAAGEDVERLQGDNFPELLLSGLHTDQIIRTPPIALIDPMLDGGSTLLGSANDLAAEYETPTVREELVLKGLPAAAPAGRADDFRWSDSDEKARQ